MDARAARKAQKRLSRAKIRTKKLEARSQLRRARARAREQQEARELEIDRRARELAIACKPEVVEVPSRLPNPTIQHDPEQAKQPVFNRHAWQKDLAAKKPVMQKQEASGFRRARWKTNGLDK
jgi:hypothetical protein